MAEQLPFDDGALDAVVTTSAFHFFNQPAALREFHRVLASGGLVAVAHPIAQMGHHLTMLAYDMNGEPVSYGHGAPLRLRNELEHGFRHVKWLKGIEFIAHYSRSVAVTAVTTKTTKSSGVTRPSSGVSHR